MNYLALQTGSFESFKRSAYNIPILEKEEEYKLIENAQSNCKESRDKLLYHNIRSVFFVLKNFTWNNVSEEDMFQEGFIGLIKSIDLFDLKSNIRFISYAYYYIKSHIIDFIKNNMKVIKMGGSKDKRKVFNNIKGILDTSHASEIVYSHIQKVAKELDVSESDVIDVINWLYGQKSCIVINEKGHEDYINELSYTPEVYEDDQLQMMYDNLDLLKPEWKELIKEYYLSDEPPILQDMAKKYGVSHQAIQQKLKKSINKLKELCNE